MPVDAVTSLWKGTNEPETEAWQIDDQDRFFPRAEAPLTWPKDDKGLCIPLLQRDLYDLRYTVKGELVQALLDKEEQEELWFDQFVPLRTHILPEMVLTKHEWGHSALSFTAEDIYRTAKGAQILHLWNHKTDSHSIQGHGSAAECNLWSAVWAAALTTEGRESFHLKVEHQVTEIDFTVTAAVHKPTAIPPDHFLLWWAVRTFRSTMDCLRVPVGIYISLKWCKRVLWEGHVNADLQASQLIDVVQTLWDPVIQNEEIRLIHGASASRLLPEHSLRLLGTWENRAGAFVLHIVTRIQGGGGGKNPQAVALKNQVASALLDLQYDLEWVSKAVDSLFNHLGHAAIAALMNGKKESRATVLLNAMQQIGLELPQKRSGARALHDSCKPRSGNLHR